MKTYRNFYLLGFVLFLVSGLLRPAYSQVLVKEGPKGFECQLIGRVFFDGGYFINDPQDLKNSFQVNDVRLEPGCVFWKIGKLKLNWDMVITK